VTTVPASVRASPLHQSNIALQPRRRPSR
jgi:hypothetical protein